MLVLRQTSRHLSDPGSGLVEDVAKKSQYMEEEPLQASTGEKKREKEGDWKTVRSKNKISSDKHSVINTLWAGGHISGRYKRPDRCKLCAVNKVTRPWNAKTRRNASHVKKKDIELTLES
ncbi:hypothetical protein HHI36_024210, partial [Cryptolaemus montrouzieri]